MEKGGLAVKVGTRGELHKSTPPSENGMDIRN